MSYFMTALLTICGTLLLAMSGVFCWMVRRGKSPGSSKAFALLFGASGTLIPALQVLRWVKPGFPVNEASAAVGIGSAIAARALRVKYKIPAK